MPSQHRPAGPIFPRPGRVYGFSGKPVRIPICYLDTRYRRARMLLCRLIIYIMKTHPNKLMQEMKSLCAELRPEDGRSPVALKKAELRQQSAEHPPSQARARQYCKAVHRALEAGLSSVCGDERLKDLTIQLVEPLHTGSNLLVIVAVPPIAQQSMLELERTLKKAAGLLRSVIATEIQRKRTPHLTFSVVPET